MMSKTERIAVWVMLSLLLVTVVTAIPLFYGEIAALRQQLNLLAGGQGATSWPPGVAPLPTVPANQGQAEVGGARLQVRVTAVKTTDDTATLTVMVRGSGAADPLLDLPALSCGGVAYPVDGPSLEAARTAFLTLITRSEATGDLLFYGTPDVSQPCVLVLNPAQATNSVVAPRIEVPVPQTAPVTPEA